MTITKPIVFRFKEKAIFIFPYIVFFYGRVLQNPKIVFANPVGNSFIDHILMMGRISTFQEALLDPKKTRISKTHIQHFSRDVGGDF